MMKIKLCMSDKHFTKEFFFPIGEFDNHWIINCSDKFQMKISTSSKDLEPILSKKSLKKFKLV